MAAFAVEIVAAYLVFWLRFAFFSSLQGPDFYTYYATSLLERAEGMGRVYDLGLQVHYQGLVTSRWPGSFRLLPFISPPFLSALLYPAALLPLRAAYMTWALLQAALLGGAVYAGALAAGLSNGSRRWAALLCAAYLPAFVVVLQGQADGLTTLGLALSALAWTRGRQGLAGLALGLALVKPQLMLLLPALFLARLSWRALLGLGAATAILVLALAPVFGLDGWRGYLGLTLPWAASGHSGFPISGQTGYSLRGLAVSLLGGQAAGLLTTALCALALLIPLSWRPHRPRLDFALAAAASVCLSPYENYHDLAVLLVPGLLLAGLLEQGRLRWPRAGVAAMAASYLGICFGLALGPAVGALAIAVLVAYLAAERLVVAPDPVPLGRLGPGGRRPRRVVVLPAYHAERTLRRVVEQIPRDEVDEILLVDDASSDRTFQVAEELGVRVIRHAVNLGYGGNQKTCYANALALGAEVVVMLHPDGQYDPALLPALCEAVESGGGDVALGSRWLGLDPAQAGMPWWKRAGNRFLTGAENLILGQELSEYHTGYRAYSRRFLESLPLAAMADGFVFDSQVLVLAAAHGWRVAEIPAVGLYFEGMSSIGLGTSVAYGLRTLGCLFGYVCFRAGLPIRWLRATRVSQASGEMTSTSFPSGSST